MWFYNVVYKDTLLSTVKMYTKLPSYTYLHLDIFC